MKTVQQRAEDFAHIYDEEDRHFAEECYARGATEQRMIDIDKACEWLKKNWRNHINTDADGMIRFSGWQSDFKKAMEE